MENEMRRRTSGIPDPEVDQRLAAARALLGRAKRRVEADRTRTNLPPRGTISVRFGGSERVIVEVISGIAGLPVTTWIRGVAVEAAVRELGDLLASGTAK